MLTHHVINQATTLEKSILNALIIQNLKSVRNAIKARLTRVQDKKEIANLLKHLDTVNKKLIDQMPK